MYRYIFEHYQSVTQLISSPRRPKSNITSRLDKMKKKKNVYKPRIIPMAHKFIYASMYISNVYICIYIIFMYIIVTYVLVGSPMLPLVPESVINQNTRCVQREGGSIRMRLETWGRH